jgi:hypothetical protein
LFIPYSYDPSNNVSGGGRLLDESTGKMVYKKDQIFSSTANAFMRAMELMYPVAVIAGKNFLIYLS